ncbi:hypothetical protein FEM48_Zijuj01G0107800 [Ziziphus jujuba var. spinosa]|uniref:Uncharacterized protein n=1 Tax=Ziziphus jujuba var. spinosa TaxID=714518 RepID=A0A978W0T9_ZIZJJ|nr:hypothetical protein FEM48_Zijuj01G0107800 [Ziziphus jujuba var. spinosa]
MGNKKWAKVNDGQGDSYYQDIAFYNGRFYAMDVMGLTIAVDPSSLEVTQVAAPMSTYGHRYVGFIKTAFIFTGSSFRGVKDDFPGWDAGLFDMEDNVAQPLKSVIGYS